MKLLDTMVLVGAVNPADRFHRAALAHARDLQASAEVHVPTSSLIEFDLVMRNQQYTEPEISQTWNALTPLIANNIVATTASAHLAAVALRSKGLTYFDSLIAALGNELKAVVVTRDPAISRLVLTEW